MPKWKIHGSMMARMPVAGVVWQTALNPAVALELLASRAWSGTGVLGPEAFPAQPFLDLLEAYGSPHGVLELEQQRRRAGPRSFGGAKLSIFV